MFGKKTPSELTRRVAFHEAGHAVIAHVVGATIEYVTTEPAAVKAAGATFGLTQTVDLDQGPAERLVLVALAGSLAEERAMGNADQWARTNERGRLEELLEIAREIGKRDGPPAITPEEEVTASQLLEANWPAVIAVAAALTAKGRLSGAAIVAIVEAAVPPAAARSAP